MINSSRFFFFFIRQKLAKQNYQTLFFNIKVKKARMEVIDISESLG